MKKIVFIFILSLISFLSAEELTGFFGFNLGDTIEKLQNDECFELLEELKTPNLKVFLNLSDTKEIKELEKDCKVYRFRPWEFEHESKSWKKKIKINNKERRLYSEGKYRNKNDKKTNIQDRFRYAGSEIGRSIYFCFYQSKLISLEFHIDTSGDYISKRDENYGGYFYDEKGSPIFPDISEKGFMWLQSMLVEKYMLKSFQDFYDYLTGKKTGFIYTSQDLSTMVIFEYPDDYSLQNSVNTNFQANSGTIRLIDLKKITEYRIKKLRKNRKLSTKI